MNTTVSRKSFLTSLGAAGVGAGLLRFAPAAAAQDADADQWSDSAGMMDPSDWEAERIELYVDFTEALAAELGNTTADDVDAAIRTAIMSLIDDHVAEAGFTKGQAEALKVIVATTDVPITPGFMGMGMGLGPGPGPMMGRGGMMHGDDGNSRGRGRMRGRHSHGDGHGHMHGAGPMAPGVPPVADQAAPTPPEAPGTPEAGS